MTANSSAQSVIRPSNHFKVQGHSHSACRSGCLPTGHRHSEPHAHSFRRQPTALNALLHRRRNSSVARGNPSHPPKHQVITWWAGVLHHKRCGDTHTAKPTASRPVPVVNTTHTLCTAHHTWCRCHDKSHRAPGNIGQLKLASTASEAVVAYARSTTVEPVA